MRSLAAALSLSLLLPACARSARDAAPASDSGAAPAASAPAEGAGQGGGRQMLSPRDSVSATVGGTTLSVNYGRPSMRGRAVFGGLVPYDRVWRTGANEATAFTTSAPVTLGATTVPAGSYTLYSLPKAVSVDCAEGQDGPAAGELAVNRQTGQWGTQYDQSQDLARVPMHGCRLSAPVEQFAISIVPSGSDGGVIRLEWETSRYSIPFKVAR